ncbi:alpha/beta hydrolase [Verrucomicrobium sp. BvORR034]|uniref:alpha/beta fold hydrolase n=1 Tax=Verrucomicrobium sp. BvORR034 TaxID=1396418 RepID=UPI0006787704|nr:alpha/beta hydrolase [Verrucomicrobium sp. BvORR034]
MPFLTLQSGRKLAYEEYGDPAGVPLFYFHGWPGSRLQGELFHPSGVKHRLRIIACDRPGLGKSDFQPGRQLLDWPPLMTELADHLQAEKFHVLGVSGGGPYVLAMAHAMPERLLSAGVICGAPPLKLVGTQELMWTYKLALWGQRHTPLLLGPGLAVAARFLGLPRDHSATRLFLKQQCERDRLAMSDAELFRIMTSAGRESLLSGARAVSTDGNIYSSDWGIDLADVHFPLRYWHGARDNNIPPALVERFVKRLPHATLTILPEEGHYSLPMLCGGQIVAELLGKNGGTET